MGSNDLDFPEKVVGRKEILTSPAPARDKSEVADEVRRKLANRRVWDGKNSIKKTSEQEDLKKEVQEADQDTEENKEETSAKVERQEAKNREGEAPISVQTKEEKAEEVPALTHSDLLKRASSELAPGEFLGEVLQPIRVRFDLPDIEVTEEFSACQIFESDNGVTPNGVMFTLGYQTTREDEITKPRSGRNFGVTIGIECENSIFFQNVKRLPFSAKSEALGLNFMLFLVQFSDKEKQFMQRGQT